MKASEIAQVRERLILEQDNVCPLCKHELQHPCLDHDHKTGFVRDVLCRTCNSAEGRLKSVLIRCGIKNPLEYIQNLLTYYDKHTINQHGLVHPKHNQKNKSGTRKKRG